MPKIFHYNQVIGLKKYFRVPEGPKYIGKCFASLKSFHVISIGEKIRIITRNFFILMHIDITPDHHPEFSWNTF
jgi:hypothetical protein